MNKTSYFISMLVVLSVAVIFFGQVAASADNLTLTVMYNRNEFSEAMQKEFEAANPGVKIEFIETDFTRLTSMISAGTPPQVCRVQSQQIPYFAVRELLLPLDEYVAKSKAIKVDDLELSVNSFRYDVAKKIQGVGPLYGFPKDYSLIFDWFYRKDLLEKAGVPLPSATEPMTYAEFAKMCAKLVVHEGDRTVRWGYYGAVTEPEMTLDLLLAQKGLTLYDDQMKKLNLSKNPEAVKIAQFIYNLAKNRITNSPIDPTDAWLGANLSDEQPRIALYQYGYWAGAMYNTTPLADKIGFAPGPKWGDKPFNGGLVTGIAIFKSDKQELNDAAWKFVEYYTAGKPAEDRAKSGWGLPMLKSMRKLAPTDKELDQVRLNTTTLQLDAGNYHVFQGNPYAFQPVDVVWNKYWADVLTDKMKMDDFLATVDREVNELIQDGLATVGE